MIHQVDYIITDSPLLLVLAYYNHPADGFVDMVRSDFKTYDNSSYFLNRVKHFNPNGRNENREQAIALDNTIKMNLRDCRVDYATCDADYDAPNKILKDIVGNNNEISYRLSN